MISSWPWWGNYIMFEFSLKYLDNLWRLWGNTVMSLGQLLQKCSSSSVHLRPALKAEEVPSTLVQECISRVQVKMFAAWCFMDFYGSILGVCAGILMSIKFQLRAKVAALTQNFLCFPGNNKCGHMHPSLYLSLCKQALAMNSPRSAAFRHQANIGSGAAFSFLDWQHFLG